jgi:hypothetical protein
MSRYDLACEKQSQTLYISFCVHSPYFGHTLPTRNHTYMRGVIDILRFAFPLRAQPDDSKGRVMLVHNCAHKLVGGSMVYKLLQP